MFCVDVIIDKENDKRFYEKRLGFEIESETRTGLELLIRWMVR